MRSEAWGDWERAVANGGLPYSERALHRVG